MRVTMDFERKSDALSLTTLLKMIIHCSYSTTKPRNFTFGQLLSKGLNGNDLPNFFVDEDV